MKVCLYGLLATLAAAACSRPPAQPSPTPAGADAGDAHAQEVAFCARECASSCTPDEHGGSNFACAGAPGNECETRCVARCAEGTRFCSFSGAPMCGTRYPLHCIPVAGVKPDAGYVLPDGGTAEVACRSCHVRCVDFSGPAVCASGGGGPGCEQCRPTCTSGDAPMCSSLLVSCASGASRCVPM
jgi:hypothetical protein